MSVEQPKTITEIAERLRTAGKANLEGDLDWSSEEVGEHFLKLAEEIETAQKRESEAIERIVRDAIISYLELFPSAPNDDAEAELKQRAETANAWLVSHGFKPEAVIWSKEEVSQF